MARGCIIRSNMLLTRWKREAHRGKSTDQLSFNRFSRKAEASEAFAAEDSHGDSEINVIGSKTEDSSCWVPHPKTGIYFPKGQEWVMNDVPEDAASFAQTCWFRNDDGVDGPNL